MKALVLIFSALVLLTVEARGNSAVHPQKNDKGKWGIVDDSGSYIVKPVYTDIEYMDNDLFMVASGGKYKDGVLEGEKWGVIDSNGNPLLKVVYDDIGDFINGLASVSINGKTGFVNDLWNVVIEPRYDFTGTPNKQGFVWVNIGGKPDRQHAGTINGGKYGVLNVNGNVVVPVDYVSIGVVSENKYYYDDASIYNATDEMERLMLECGSHSALWSKGIEQRPGSMMPEAIGFSFSSKRNLSANGICGLDGKILVNCNIYQRCAMPSDGMAMVVTKQGKLGFHDVASDKLESNPAIRTAFPFRNNVAIGIDVKNQWGFYDKKLRQVGDTYNWISPLINNMYLVRKGNRMSLINAADYSVICGDKNFIFPLKEGYMAFKDNDKNLWGFLNEDGSVAVEPRYHSVYSFNHGVACVKDSSGWGMIDSKMKEIVPLKWDSILFPSDDNFTRIWVTGNDGLTSSYHCIDRDTGKMAFDKAFTESWNYIKMGDGEYAAVGMDGKYGYITATGEIAVPVEMNSKESADRALWYKHKHGIIDWLPIHTYRFSIMENTKLNSYKLNDTLPGSVWDY